MGHSPVTAQSIVLLQDRYGERHKCGTDVSIVNQYAYKSNMTLLEFTCVCVCRHPRVFLACSAQIICPILSLIQYDMI